MKNSELIDALAEFSDPRAFKRNSISGEFYEHETRRSQARAYVKRFVAKLTELGISDEMREAGTDVLFAESGNIAYFDSAFSEALAALGGR